MIELTDQQTQELTSPEPVAVDPRTGQVYVLVRQEVYQRLRGVLGQDELDSVGVAALVEQTMRDYDQDDPLLESYQKYRR